ncbi:hypothetical protein CHF27_009525 [Romboutsia maritimum]|uniref:DUF1129 domain-containing protein n=1 Tax=Romboutsia maritimum TaxID=2020948 RepID=A0A371IRS4_9FIRM|nr:hypothetical protein [Romboutsia maritimum]RDY23179.1 hypothetical protein CHF27_009525 [Romboutsia maritimum]
MCMSKEGKDFILDLNMYLIFSGKSEKEVKEFIEEAEQHLILGEKEGKSVKDIFGDSPEEYAKSVEKELSFDKKEILRMGFILILGLASWIFLSDLDYGVYKCSMLEAIGMPVTYIITIICLILFTKKFAFKDKKWKISIYIVMLLNLVALVAIGLIGKKLPQVEVFGEFTIRIIILLLLLACIIVSIKIRTTATIFPFIVNIPKVLYYLFNINISNLETPALIAGVILMFIALKLESRENLEEE